MDTNKIKFLDINIWVDKNNFIRKEQANLLATISENTYMSVEFNQTLSQINSAIIRIEEPKDNVITLGDFSAPTVIQE